MSFEYSSDDVTPTTTPPLVNGWGYFVDLFGSQAAQYLRLLPGSAWAPSFTFFGDNRTGMFQPFPSGFGFTIDGYMRFLLSDEGTAYLNKLGFSATFSADSLTADRTYTLPNQSGTLALENILSKINGVGSAVSAGQPVVLDGTTDFVLAQADDIATCAFGLALQDTADAAAGQIAIVGFVEVADWTDVVGSSSLTAGAAYYLSVSNPGELTATPPNVGPGYLQYVGRAVTAQKMFVQIAQPIQL